MVRRWRVDRHQSRRYRVESSYSGGNVTGEEIVGGLIGGSVEEGHVEKSYSTGNVTGDTDVGGFIGLNEGSVDSSFWDTEASGHDEGVGDGDDEGMIGETTEEMRNRTTFIGEDWDFTETWWMVDNETYPLLRWQDVQMQIYPEESFIDKGRSETYTAFLYDELGEEIEEVTDEIEWSDDVEPKEASFWDQNEITVDETGVWEITGEVEINGETLTATSTLGVDVIGIHDWYDLDDVRDDLEANYTLMNDLDEDSDGYDELVDTEYGWEPIQGFGGTLDGNEYEISDLYVNREDEIQVGLFGIIGEEAEITDVSLTGIKIVGEGPVGGLVGLAFGVVENSSVEGEVSGERDVGGVVGANGGTVENSYATGNVSGERYVGALAGHNNGGIVENSYATGDVRGSENVGGLVGSNDEGIVENSHATGNVRGDISLGGLVGNNFGVTVENSYATGNVSGNHYIGGLTGTNRARVENSYATGNVSGEEFVGGLTGRIMLDGIVSNSYATGNVSGEENVGGLIGEGYEDAVKNSFWDVETSDQDESDGGTGKTTAEMKEVETYTDTDTEGLDEPWDFIGDPYDDEGLENIWHIDEEEDINDGYPFLSWQDVEIQELEISKEGEGNVSIGEKEIETPYRGYFEEDDEVELEALPEEGWIFDRWIGDVPEGDEEDEEITLDMDMDRTVEANFEKEEYELTVDIAEDDEGEVYVDGTWYGPEDLQETFTYNYGEEVDLDAEGDEDWSFEEWYVELEDDTYSEDADIEVEMTEDMELTAHFKEEFELTLMIEGAGRVEYEFDKDYDREEIEDEDKWIFTVEEGTEVTLEIDEDYEEDFEGWDLPDELEDELDEDETEITFEMYDDYEITANFEEGIGLGLMIGILLVIAVILAVIILMFLKMRGGGKVEEEQTTPLEELDEESPIAQEEQESTETTGEMEELLEEEES